MQPTQNPLIAISLSTLLFSCGGLTGTGEKSASSSSLANSLSSGEAVSISSIYPASGNVTSVPTSVTVTFSSSALEPAGAQSITSYSINCGGNSLAALSVTTLAGIGSVTAALPPLNGLALGTVCTFNVSGNVKDGRGNFVTGNHSVTYTISNNPNIVAGWNEAVVSTPTPSVGSSVGTPFTGLGSDGFALNGLLLNGGGQYVNGIVGVWAPFGSTNLTYGPPHGTSAGGYSQFSCPAGYRMTGVYGRAGNYIDAIGIKCKTADQSQSYQSALFGGAGGASFELSCPAGKFATDLNGHATSYLEALSLGCR